jgi:hypothetical protein
MIAGTVNADFEPIVSLQIHGSKRLLVKMPRKLAAANLGR